MSNSCSAMQQCCHTVDRGSIAGASYFCLQMSWRLPEQWWTSQEAVCSASHPNPSPAHTKECDNASREAIKTCFSFSKGPQSSQDTQLWPAHLNFAFINTDVTFSALAGCSSGCRAGHLPTGRLVDQSLAAAKESLSKILSWCVQSECTEERACVNGWVRHEVLKHCECSSREELSKNQSVPFRKQSPTLIKPQNIYELRPSVLILTQIPLSCFPKPSARISCRLTSSRASKAFFIIIISTLMVSINLLQVKHPRLKHLGSLYVSDVLM